MRAAILAALLLAGCASPGPLTGICGVQPIGQNENGLLVVRYRCEPQ